LSHLTEKCVTVWGRGTSPQPTPVLSSVAGAMVTLTTRFSDGTSATAIMTVASPFGPAVVDFDLSRQATRRVGQSNMALVADGAVDGINGDAERGWRANSDASQAGAGRRSLTGTLSDGTSTTGSSAYPTPLHRPAEARSHECSVTHYVHYPRWTPLARCKFLPYPGRVLRDRHCIRRDACRYVPEIRGSWPADLGRRRGTQVAPTSTAAWNYIDTRSLPSWLS